MANNIIHADGVRFAVSSSAPPARNLLSSRHALVQAISQPGVAAPARFACVCQRQTALSGGKSAPALAWCWVTFAEQGMVISRERRSRSRDTKNR
jgi:hypothetical protein